MHHACQSLEHLQLELFSRAKMQTMSQILPSLRKGLYVCDSDMDMDDDLAHFISSSPETLRG
jgi:hypothetical protein